MLGLELLVLLLDRRERLVLSGVAFDPGPVTLLLLLQLVGVGSGLRLSA